MFPTVPPPPQRLLVFARLPEPGKVKTRRAAAIGAERALAVYEAMLRDVIASIQCPTRVIYVEPAFQYFSAELRNARIAVLRHGESAAVPGGHHLHMEDPDAVMAAIGDFLTRPI